MPWALIKTAKCIVLMRKEEVIPTTGLSCGMIFSDGRDATRYVTLN